MFNIYILELWVSHLELLYRTESLVKFLEETGILLLSCGIHWESYPVDKGVLYLRLKWLEHEVANHFCSLPRLKVHINLLPFADEGCRVVSATDLHGHILSFLDWSRHYFFQVAPQLYQWGWVDPVPDPLLLRKSGSAGNRTWYLWICSQELWPLDHRDSHKIGLY
jgi:hypothetical protein